MLYAIDSPISKAILDDSTEGFSPCPPEITHILATYVAPTKRGGTLFDSCAGTGAAAAALAKAWGLRPNLVEPHESRHRACLQHDPNALRAPAQWVTAHSPTVWFFNPPFDPSDGSGSMERHLFWHGVNSVPGVGTFCVWLLPSRVLDDEEVQKTISTRFVDPKLAKFPEPWFGEYGQVVVLGHWCDPHSALETSIRLEQLPPLEPCRGPYRLSAVGASFVARIASERRSTVAA